MRLSAGWVLGGVTVLVLAVVLVALVTPSPSGTLPPSQRRAPSPTYPASPSPSPSPPSSVSKSALDIITQAASADPLSAVALLEPLVLEARGKLHGGKEEEGDAGGEDAHSGAAVAAEVWDALGDAYARALRPADAARCHRLAVEAWRALSPKAITSKILGAEVALANDLSRSYNYDASLDIIRKVRKTPALPADVQGLLLRMESSVLECKGDYISALHVFEQSLGAGAKARDTESARLHLDLLKRTLQTTHEGAMPQSVRRAMEQRARSLEDALIATGPWQRRLQLPRTFIPGLRAAPFHNLSSFSGLEDAAQTIIGTAGALREEFQKLKAAGKLVREQECIHENTLGEWQRYEITGNWVPRGLDGCSIEAPAACLLLSRLRASGLPVIRLGYSAIAANTWLKPHFGMTNGQLKFHLGLVVPTGDDGQACAHMRVAEEQQAWQADKVLFFDDSFEHEVWNRCREERVVVQVVFVHPDLDATAAGVQAALEGH